MFNQNKKCKYETAIKDDFVLVFGEVTTTPKVDYKEVAINILKEIGYNETFNVLEKISRQSPDIALGVDSTESHEQGAGDQGIMFGYACNETQELMPLPIMLANQISKEMDKERKEQYSHIFGVNVRINL